MKNTLYFFTIWICCSVMVCLVLLPTIVGCEQPKSQSQAQVQVQQETPKNYRLEFIEVQQCNNWGHLCIVRDKQTEHEFIVATTQVLGYNAAPGVAIWPLGPSQVKKPSQP